MSDTIAPLRALPAPAPPTPGARADEIFGELSIITRRLAGLHADVRALAAAHRGEPCPWSGPADMIGQALRSARGAVAALPLFTLVAGHPGEIVLGELRISTAARRALLGEIPLDLAARGFDLLVRLAHAPQQVVPRQVLMREVWGYDSRATRTLDSHASRLRHAFRAAGAPEGAYVISAWGVGYSLLPPCGPGWPAEAAA